ncbi:MAG: hypothetical protein PVF17_05935 [Ignavibacteria bacterium]|jgi:hypothetical protein
MNNDPEQWLNKSNDFSNEIYFYTEESIKNPKYFNYGKVIVANNKVIGLDFTDSIPIVGADSGKLPYKLWGRDKSYQTIKEFIEDTDINFFNKETNPELFI